MLEHDAETVALLGLNPDGPPIRVASGRSSSRVNLLPGNPRGVAFPQTVDERRRSERLAPEQTRWSESARVRPGFDALILNIGTRGALIELRTRLHVGARVEVCLVTADAATRLDLAGVVRRCVVTGLNPMSYRGAVEFDREIELRVLNPFAVPDGLTA